MTSHKSLEVNSPSRTYKVHIFGLDNASTGSNSMAFTTNPGVTGAVYGAICFEGQEASPVGATAENNAGCTVDITTTQTDSLIVALSAVRSNTTPPTITPEANQTEVFNTESGAATTEIKAAGFYRAATSITSYTVGGTTGVTTGDIAIAVEIKAVSNDPPTVSLNSPADAGSISDSTPNLDFTGTDSQSDDIRYNVQVDTVNTFDSGGTTSTSTYYFDGSDASASDPNSVWTNDANAFDGNTGTTASCSTNGSTSSNYLMAEGTNAPSSGGTIVQVRAVIYGGSTAANTSAAIYTDGLGELLGTPTHSGSAGYESYTTLSAPTGGWTWAKIQALEVKIYRTSGMSACLPAKVEVEVTLNGPLLDKVSGTDSGFANPDNGGDTDPFTSGENIQYTVDVRSQTQSMFQVNASSDDARNTNGGTSPVITAISQYLGINSSTDYWNGWRWTNVTVPQGATIVSATLDLYSAQLTSGTAKAIFYGVNEDDLTTFNTSTSYPEGKSRTTASKAVNFNMTAWTNTLGYGAELIDVKDLVQEIINRSGWVSGNAMGIVAHDNASGGTNNYVGHSTYDRATDRGAKLTITYLPGSPDLSAGTYYWRVRGIDPSGSNSYGAWSATRSFTVTSAAAPTDKFFMFFS